jgi:hypothetical protein
LSDEYLARSGDGAKVIALHTSPITVALPTYLRMPPIPGIDDAVDTKTL